MKKATAYRRKIKKIQNVSKLLQKKLDLKQILIKIHNFEENMANVLTNLKIKRYYIDEAQIMREWEKNYVNQVSDKIKISPQIHILKQPKVRLPTNP